MKFKDYLTEKALDRGSYRFFNKLAMKYDAIEWDYSEKFGYTATFKKENRKNAEGFMKDIQKTLGTKMKIEPWPTVGWYVSKKEE